MQADSRILDDVARVLTGAMGAATGARGEVDSLVRRQFERILASMDVVSRDEFEAVREMAAKARAEQEALTARVALLEKKIAKLSKAKSG